MKSYLIFIAVLLSSISQASACGYSPYGEDIRYSLFLPEYFDYHDFSAFYYNSQEFGFDYNYQNQYESNVYDWFNYTNKKVAIEEINECLNALKFTDINANATNQFVQYLYKNKLNDVIQYLLVAKKCEEFSSFDISDPWERKETLSLNFTSTLNELHGLIDSEKNGYLKRKYAFLAIRVAFYCSDYDLIRTLFLTHYAQGEKDYLYYWALFFNSFQNKNASIDIATIMAYSPEKKYACYYYFNRSFNLKNALAQARSAEDIANVYAYASVQRLEPNLDYLKKIYTNTKKSRILDFLLLREINKIEDWIYTPYYTNYLPSIQQSEYWWSDKVLEVQTTETLRARSERDRIYAKQVLDFVNSIDYSKINDALLWRAAQIQLLFMTRNYNECLNKINSFEKKYRNNKVFSQIEKIKALCIVSNQDVGKAIVKDEAKTLVLKYLEDERFLFSLGRELEFRGNLPDGLALIAYGNRKIKNNYSDYYSSSVEWQGNRLKKSGNLKYFSDYFDYLDFVYSADELKKICNKLDKKMESDFYKTIYSQLLEDKDYIKDLLGTKYIRENRLQEAAKTFESIGPIYWEENYNAWERDKYDDYYTFDKNPFYDLKYTSSFIPHSDKYVVTKLAVTKYLIKYLALANNAKTKDRDYYYFIIGNCYLNMTQYGHSWMMRRFSSVSSYRKGNPESYIDEIEYRNCSLAKKYYHLAYVNAKDDKFKALCLKMEDYAINNIGSNYEKLKEYYPQYYDDLSNCIYLEEYFKK